MSLSAVAYVPLENACYELALLLYVQVLSFLYAKLERTRL